VLHKGPFESRVDQLAADIGSVSPGTQVVPGSGTPGSYALIDLDLSRYADMRNIIEEAHVTSSLVGILAFATDCAMEMLNSRKVLKSLPNVTRFAWFTISL
jgi:sigma54-dependent transcription regulator